MKKAALCTRDYREVVKERVFRAGYVVRTERVGMKGNPEIVMASAYTPNGDYIGTVKFARSLIVKRGIRPQLAGPYNVCSIGYCAREKKWYGWSHRAIYGFKVGSTVRKGDVLAESGDYKLGERAKNLAAAKAMAVAFAEEVS